MYVEIERARLTRRLAQMTEEAGKVSEAADILQEVAVVCTQGIGTGRFEDEEVLDGWV